MVPFETGYVPSEALSLAQSPTLAPVSEGPVSRQDLEGTVLETQFEQSDAISDVQRVTVEDGRITHEVTNAEGEIEDVVTSGYTFTVNDGDEREVVAVSDDSLAVFNALIAAKSPEAIAEIRRADGQPITFDQIARAYLFITHDVVGYHSIQNLTRAGNETATLPVSYNNTQAIPKPANSFEPELLVDQPMGFYIDDTESQELGDVILNRSERTFDFPCEGFTEKGKEWTLQALNDIPFPGVKDRVKKVSFKMVYDFDGEVDPNARAAWAGSGKPDSSGELYLFGSMAEDQIQRRTLRSLIHECAHSLSPFQHGVAAEANVDYLGGPDVVKEIQDSVDAVIAQSISTRKYLNGYHEDLINKFEKGKIDETIMRNEMMSILTEFTMENPKHLLEVAESQFRRNTNGKRVDLYDFGVKYVSLLMGGVSRQEVESGSSALRKKYTVRENKLRQ